MFFCSLIGGHIAKGQAAQEGWSVRETERIMDVELFLEEQTKWEEDNPLQLVMLYEMVRHVANKGQKEAKQTSAKAARRALLSWTQRWTHPPYSLLAPKLQMKKSSPFILKFTSNKVARIPTQGTGAGGGGGVLL